MVRLTVIPEIKFNKLLSDYVIINTFTVALLIFSGIIFALNSYKFAALIFIVMYLFLQYHLRISSGNIVHCMKLEFQVFTA